MGLSEGPILPLWICSTVEIVTSGLSQLNSSCEEEAIQISSTGLRSSRLWVPFPSCCSLEVPQGQWHPEPLTKRGCNCLWDLAFAPCSSVCNEQKQYKLGTQIPEGSGARWLHALLLKSKGKGNGHDCLLACPPSPYIQWECMHTHRGSMGNEVAQGHVPSWGRDRDRTGRGVLSHILFPMFSLKVWGLVCDLAGAVLKCPIKQSGALLGTGDLQHAHI